MDDVQESVYLTDGYDLFRVLRAWAPSGQVMLEDCMYPESPALVLPVKQLAADGMRVVRPSPA